MAEVDGGDLACGRGTFAPENCSREYYSEDHARRQGIDQQGDLELLECLALEAIGGMFTIEEHTIASLEFVSVLSWRVTPFALSENILIVPGLHELSYSAETIVL